MPAPPPFEDIFSKVKHNAGKASQQVGLVTKMTKLKVEIATQNSEKERYIRSIGDKTYAIFCRDKKLDGKFVEAEILTELTLIGRIEKHITELQEEIAHLQAEFRHAEKDIVDAAEVKETDDDTSSRERRKKDS